MSTIAADPLKSGEAVACGGRAPLGKGQNTAGVRGPTTGSAVGMMVEGSSVLPVTELAGSHAQPR